MISTAIFDLETSALDANQGIILCGVIKSSKRNETIIIRSDETNPGWKHGKRGNDKETVKRITRVLQSHDVLVAHNGNRFDLPYLRTRSIHWGLPRLPDMKLIDPLQIAWRKFKMNRNSLGSIAGHVGVRDKKTPIDWEDWMAATYDGDTKAMDRIVKHCVADVNVLEGVLEVVKPYVKVLDDRGSGL